MKKKIVYALLIVALLGIFSCDRFDHNFKPLEQVDFNSSYNFFWTLELPGVKIV